MVVRGNVTIFAVAVAIIVTHYIADFHIAEEFGKVVFVIIDLSYRLIAKFGYNLVLRTAIGNERAVVFIPFAVVESVSQCLAYLQIHNGVFNGCFYTVYRSAFF